MVSPKGHPDDCVVLTSPSLLRIVTAIEEANFSLTELMALEGILAAAFQDSAVSVMKRLRAGTTYRDPEPWR